MKGPECAKYTPESGKPAKAVMPEKVINVLIQWLPSHREFQVMVLMEGEPITIQKVAAKSSTLVGAMDSATRTMAEEIRKAVEEALR